MEDSEEKNDGQLSPCVANTTTDMSPEKSKNSNGSEEKNTNSSPIDVEIESDEKVLESVKNLENTVERNEKDKDSITENHIQHDENE